jgi:hypothetical protein
MCDNRITPALEAWRYGGHIYCTRDCAKDAHDTEQRAAGYKYRNEREYDDALMSEIRELGEAETAAAAGLRCGDELAKEDGTDVQR